MSKRSWLKKTVLWGWRALTNVAEKQLDSFGGEFGMRFFELVPIGLEGFVGEDVGSIDEEVDGGFLQLGGFVTVA